MRYLHVTQQPRMVETDFTRQVFECLYANALTINGIVKLIGYDNAYGRKKVAGHLTWKPKVWLRTTAIGGAK